MKKILIITALLLFASSTAFAGVSVSITDPLSKSATGKTLYGAASGSADANSPLIGKTSTGVGVGVLCVTGGTGYSLVTQHLNGTKAYGSSYDSTSIFAKDVTTVGIPLLAVPSKTDTSDFTNWTAL